MDIVLWDVLFALFSDLNDVTHKESSFYLGSYTARYFGRGKIQRLRYGAKKSRDVDEGCVTSSHKRVNKGASKQLDKLRQDLEENTQHENNKVTRTGHNDLGDFYHGRGRLQQARGEYIKTRDYCMHASHNLEMCLKVMLISIECGMWRLRARRKSFHDRGEYTGYRHDL